MTNTLSSSTSVLAKAALAVALVGGVWAQPVSASPVARSRRCDPRSAAAEWGRGQPERQPVFPARTELEVDL